MNSDNSKKNTINSKICAPTSTSIKSKDIYITFENKIIYLQEVIKNTIISAQKYKTLDILTANEINICIQTLEKLFSELNSILFPIQQKIKINDMQIINKIQEINTELSIVIKSYGTFYINDLINICLGSEFVNKNINNNTDIAEKYEIINKYVHPIYYKILLWKNSENVSETSNCIVYSSNVANSSNSENTDTSNKIVLQKNRIIEDYMIIESANMLDCFDLARTSKSFQSKVYGIKISIPDKANKQNIIVCGVVDDMLLECLNYKYVTNKLFNLNSRKPKDPDFTNGTWDRFILSLTLKEILIYENKELYEKFVGYLTQIGLIKQKTINQVVKDFISSELYSQRLILIQLLLKSSDYDFQYLAYLLYDLLSNDVNGNIDTQEQTLLFDSFPWNVKKYFRDAMKQTVEYTNNLSNFDNNKIPLEQQICLLKASDNIKEKAMQKLKEVKAKSEDSGSKARQYLDGLLRVPFGIYKEEYILKIMTQSLMNFNDLIKNLDDTEKYNIEIKEKYTNIEMYKILEILKNNHTNTVHTKILDFCICNMTKNKKRADLSTNALYINNLIKKYNLKHNKICHSGKKIEYMRENIITFLNKYISNKEMIQEILNYYSNNKITSYLLNNLSNNINILENNNKEINDYMINISNTLNSAVHGHDSAKRQIERIIGQWINGDKSGYCFGFEGPPGLGKTSMAKKGIANCLKDINGETRPFSFIAIGGASNSSTLDGHNYTYVGSTWGRIVDVLMETKCMNPIIFIDELDKVSRTEHGKEIIGILTHLIDSTQNDCFQDKYFNGIDLDLSKALFIFSYNEPSEIDRILLDRIHRVKFDHLTLDDKIVITNKYLLPEIYKKIGLENILEFEVNVIEELINTYTCEPGVRKLKELLFEIISEINLLILKNNKDFEIPIKISMDDVKNNYLKERHPIKPVKINNIPKIGVINGLWANSLGKGGILHIEAFFHVTTSFLDLKLTGLQGDVMKESMNVAKTLAWSMLTKERMGELFKEFEDTKLQGLHIHVPEGGTKKDGPSAGTAITVAIYSLLTGRKIKNNIAITGEICLQGNVGPIGGLDLKILGGINAGVTCFIYPKDNNKDFIMFHEKYKNKAAIKNIEFIEVENIQEVINIVLLD
jgi:ATP-dependent Lon protease